MVNVQPFVYMNKKLKLIYKLELSINYKHYLNNSAEMKGFDGSD